MLAHLQHFYFSSLLEHFNVSHISLLHLLYCHLNARVELGRHLNNTELAFTKCFSKRVIIKHVTVTHHFLKRLYPFLLLLLWFKIKCPYLVRGNWHIHCIELPLCLWIYCFRQTIVFALQVATCQTVHILVLGISLMLVKIKLIPI